MVDVVEVKIWGQLVGAIRWDENERLAYFQYESKFVRNGWDLSPIKMPIADGNRIYSFPELRKGRGESEDTFKGLPGLLSDALPDKYGNRLIDVWLARQGRLPGSMNPVEMLAFIGSRGMGALEFEPSYVPAANDTFSVELDSLVHVAKRMLLERESFVTNLSKDEEKSMREILRIGTSAGGARPKAVIAFDPKTNEVRSGQAQVPEGFEHWLIKLDGVSGEQFGESMGWGRVEYAYYLMAKECGINMCASRLLEENGRAHFLTKRFDRDGNQKHHIQSLCGLQHYDFNDMDGYSYEQVFQTMRLLRLSYPEAEEMFRRMVFNVLATNYDDHTKNISFMLKKGERWQLAPAYDLVYAYDETNHWVSRQTLSVNGKRSAITREDFLTIATDNNIKKAKAIIDEVSDVVASWRKYAGIAGVSAELVDRIEVGVRVKD